jgi:hypothetical protein
VDSHLWAGEKITSDVASGFSRIGRNPPKGGRHASLQTLLK